MTVELDGKAVSFILSALRVAEGQWARAAEATDDEDEAAELANDVGYVQSLSAGLQAQLRADTARHAGAVAAHQAGCGAAP